MLIIGGPTASGKSDLALKYASKYNGVIINADSVQLFDKLKTLTAHPSLEEQSLAPHKLYSVLSVDQQISAPIWAKMAVVEIEQAHQNNQLPIIIGGTGFYLKALMEGLSPIPDTPKDIRQNAIDRHLELGTEGLLAELKAIDPMIIPHIDNKNGSRVMRAYEVFKATGKSLKYWQDLPRELPGKDLNFYKLALIPDREVLYERCNTRFQKMIDLGVMDEINELNQMIKDDKVPDDATILNALGFRELNAYLNQEIELDAAIEKATQITRNYAKKQITWCRNQLKPDLILSKSELVEIFN